MVYDKVMLRHFYFPKIIKSYSITHGTRTRPWIMEVSFFDFDEPLICCSTDQNKGHVFFYTCPNALLRVKHSFEKNRFSTFEAYIVETIRDREKCFN